MKFIAPVTSIILLLSAVLTSAAAPVPSGDIDFAALDAAIEGQMGKHGLPGVALAVVEGDAIAYLRGYGTAGGHEMTPQTQMFIGSQSKSFTALAIAQLAERGRIDLDAPVKTYIPWFEVANEDASSRITIDHLLHHTSGLSEAGYSMLLPPGATSEEAVRSLAQARLTARIGTKFQYFNLGYAVLAYIIETVTGERYPDYLQTHVLDPLGMAQTSAEPSTARDLSWGYTRLFGFAFPMPQPVRDYEIGAGYIVSTAEDMGRYALALKGGGQGLVTPVTAQMIFTPGLRDYGMGWFIADGGAKIFHGGANETFATHVNIYPRRNRAFVLLINQGYQIDHFVSSQQLVETVEAVVSGKTPPPLTQGWSMRWIGWGVGLLVLALIGLHTRNFYVLFKGWEEHIRHRSPAKIALDVAVSFAIPTIILVVVFSQVKAFYGYRFNLLTTLAYLRLGLPDVFILMIVGSVPDYVQGAIKLLWILGGKTRQA